MCWNHMSLLQISVRFMAASCVLFYIFTSLFYIDRKKFIRKENKEQQSIFMRHEDLREIGGYHMENKNTKAFMHVVQKYIRETKSSIENRPKSPCLWKFCCCIPSRGPKHYCMQPHNPQFFSFLIDGDITPFEDQLTEVLGKTLATLAALINKGNTQCR